jgi:hypothetical protein
MMVDIVRGKKTKVGKKLEKQESKKEAEKPEAGRAQHGRTQNIWKILAIAVIVIFALFLVSGMVKYYYIRSSFVEPTQAQVSYAVKLATGKLESGGMNVSAFQVKVEEMMRRPHDDRENRSILQVLFYTNTTTHTYLVDVNSGEVILHSETEWYARPSGQDRYGTAQPPPGPGMEEPPRETPEFRKTGQRVFVNEDMVVNENPDVVAGGGAR